jgi:hypothetical protein
MQFRRFLPQGISLYLTYHCQSRCPHCFLVENGKTGEQSVFLLVLSGGEWASCQDTGALISRYFAEPKIRYDRHTWVN